MSIANVDEFLGRHKEKLQCETRSPSGRCPDPAFYSLYSQDVPTKVYCQRCITTVIYYGTQRNRNVIIGRIEN